MTLSTIPFGRVVREVDVRAGGEAESMPLLSVSQYRGVLPRSELTDKEPRAEDLSNYKRCQRDDVVLNRMSAYQGALGLSPLAGIVSPDYAVLRATGAIEPRFLAHVMKSHWFVSEMTMRLRGIGAPGGSSVRTPRVNVEDLGDIGIPIPPRAEQQRIADFLDDQIARIDATVSARTQQVDRLGIGRRESVLAAICEGVGDATKRSSGVQWLPDFPAHWDRIPTRYLCRISTGSGDTVDAEPEGEYPFFVRSDFPERSTIFTFDCEAVLTSGDGAGVGKVFHHYEGKFHAHQRVYVLTNFARVLPRYFFHYFAASFGYVALDGSAKSTVDSVRREMLTSLPVPVGPLAEQRVIASRIDALIEQWAAAQQQLRGSIDLLNEYKRSLITAAVTGEFDVAAASGRGIPG